MALIVIVSTTAAKSFRTGIDQSKSEHQAHHVPTVSPGIMTSIATKRVKRESQRKNVLTSVDLQWAMPQTKGLPSLWPSLTGDPHQRTILTTSFAHGFKPRGHIKTRFIERLSNAYWSDVRPPTRLDAPQCVNKRVRRRKFNESSSPHLALVGRGGGTLMQSRRNGFIFGGGKIHSRVIGMSDLIQTPQPDESSTNVPRMSSDLLATRYQGRQRTRQVGPCGACMTQPIVRRHRSLAVFGLTRWYANLTGLSRDGIGVQDG